ncbi:MAG TPA: DUF3306 domain-containing protein [Pseudolabrys sp.]
MSEADDFLSRWARRKRAVAAERAEEFKPPAAEALPAPEAPPPVTSGVAPAPAARAPEAPGSAAPEFDVESLPPIESIGGDTDISAFLKPGVPSALRHAALRRAWTSDPVIRAFKGLAENDWDFNSPETPGFGPLDPGFDVKKMVAQLFGDAQPAETEAGPDLQAIDDAQAVSPSRESDAADTSCASEDSPKVETQTPVEVVMEQKIVQRDENIASQQDEANNYSTQASIRRHGSALPRVLPDC